MISLPASSLMPARTIFKGYNLLTALVVLASLAPAQTYAENAAAPVVVSPAATDTDAVKSIEEGSTAEVMWEFDPYYTNVGLYTPLTSEPISTITSDSEVEIYTKLIEGSAIPRYMLLEASVYPMPVVGTYIKSQSPDFSGICHHRFSGTLGRLRLLRQHRKAGAPWRNAHWQQYGPHRLPR
jgi:hypothetical protein